jgi:hypothetical protein
MAGRRGRKTMPHKTIERICKNCKHWRQIHYHLEDKPRNYGTCDCGAFVYTGDGDTTPDNGLGYWGTESFHAEFNTGPNFGCIHWEE